MVKIALVTTWHVRCGIADYSKNLATALAQEGAEVYVIRLPRFGYKDVAIFQNIIDSIPVDKIDVIHVQHEYGLFAGVDSQFQSAIGQLGKPVVTTMHAVGSWEIDRAIAENSTKIIVHNEHCRKIFARAPEDEAKISVIPHGLTPLRTPLPPRDLCKKRLGIQPEVPIVGYVGFISHYKGVDGLIAAMSKVPNAALLIAGGWFTQGDTEYITKLRESAQTLLPNRCQWLGYVKEEDLPATYGAMDIIVYPSRIMTESGAMLMALSHGKAVIATDLPPVREKASKGALMTFKNIDDLAGKIDILLTDKAVREEMEANATRYAEENSWSNIAKQHIKLYESIIKS